MDTISVDNWEDEVYMEPTVENKQATSMAGWRPVWLSYFRLLKCPSPPSMGTVLCSEWRRSQTGDVWSCAEWRTQNDGSLEDQSTRVRIHKPIHLQHLNLVLNQMIMMHFEDPEAQNGPLYPGASIISNIPVSSAANPEQGENHHLHFLSMKFLHNTLPGILKNFYLHVMKPPIRKCILHEYA